MVTEQKRLGRNEGVWPARDRESKRHLDSEDKNGTRPVWRYLPQRDQRGLGLERRSVDPCAQLADSFTLGGGCRAGPGRKSSRVRRIGRGRLLAGDEQRVPGRLDELRRELRPHSPRR